VCCQESLPHGTPHNEGQTEQPKQESDHFNEPPKGVEASKVIDFESFKSQFEATAQRDATANPEQQAETARLLGRVDELRL
jgi:hypothetical protein